MLPVNLPEKSMQCTDACPRAIAVLDTVSYLYPGSSEPALKDVVLEVRRGEFLGLIGPTGAGKTTLCLALNGIVPQFFGGRFFGHVTVAGLDTLAVPISTLARHVGMVFEDPEMQITATSVENEIAFALENMRVPREDMVVRIKQALEAARLEGMEHKHPHELSGGQKQRLAIAAALALQPDLLVLDEPTSQLDPVGSQEVFATVRELNKVLGMTVIMASHAAEEMAEYAGRIALLSAGELVKTGSPDELYADIELLRQHALRPPQVASTFHLIRERGVQIQALPVRLADGLNAMADLQAKRAPANLPAALPASREDTGSPLLSVRDLHHGYSDGTRALRGVTLDIHEGEYVLIIGQNGAGKSTLVKHFLKLLAPTAGEVRVAGVDTRNLTVSELARRIGYVAQNPDHQIFNASVEAEVSFALKNLDYTPDEIEARVASTLNTMGLSAARARHPLSLPRGDRARVVIAAVLAMEPDIVVFDEPTTGQDYRGARAILDISRELHQMGKTVVIITHHLYLMADYAERVIVMGAGTILLDAPVRQAFHEVDLLASTYLTPPQAVYLARALGGANDPHAYPLLTPEEIAACVAPLPAGEVA